MDETMLIQRAFEARLEAYAPYSGFRVGAAVLSDDGRVFTGVNIENASYGLTLCAERAALAQAVAEGCRRFTALAIATDSPSPTYPCGGCRQVLAEFGPDTLIIMATAKGDIAKATAQELLPHAFSGDRFIDTND
ncbi:MAG TPA: cytidine deaminase [Candidatus Aquicultor sp.]|jgi:cytidine deaminase